jgi:hypothetical protein
MEAGLATETTVGPGIEDRTKLRRRDRKLNHSVAVDEIVSRTHRSGDGMLAYAP